VIAYFSYRQTIEAYPTGGGSYTVASKNLGEFPGLLAAAALMIDYVLTAAVGIPARVGALVSAVPSLQPHTLLMCLVILLLMTIANLRGVCETGAVFIFPTYLFVGTLLITLALGLVKALAAGGHPASVIAPPTLHLPTATVGAWLLLKAFSSGCTAITGVEAVSNADRAFREPAVKSAQRTLTAVIAILIALLAGIAFLVRAYHISATNPEEAGYQSVLSQLTAAVVGKGIFYYITIGSILLVLALSANTAFADFRDSAAPSLRMGTFLWLWLRGGRLVYSQGIYALAALCVVLLILFGGITDRLIPLYAVGAFLAFTLFQAGMVAHWRRTGGARSRRSMFVNGLGRVATATTVAVVTITRFAAGAWVTTLLIPVMVILMISVRRHYCRVEAQIANPLPLDLTDLRAPLVVVPICFWNKIPQKSLRFALKPSAEVRALHINCERDTEDFCQIWDRFVEEPAKRAGLAVPHLVVLKLPIAL
jgi:amino acid transporter